MQGLGTRLTQFQLENGWSKRGLAKRLDVSTPSVLRWEEGTAEPNDYNRYKIERFLCGVKPVPVQGPTLLSSRAREASENGR